MEKIKYISGPRLDNIQKYGKYAKEVVRIIYETSNGELDKYLYLDNPKLLSEVSRHYKYLKKEKNKIFDKSLDKRLKYNAIMLGISMGILVSGMGLGLGLMSLKVNPIFVSIVVDLLCGGSVGYGFYHVNKDKFYYKKNEIKRLKKLNQEISKCETIEQKINHINKEEMAEINFKRRQIDNRNLRFRNYERNKSMNLESKYNIMESEERIRIGVQNRLNSGKLNKNYNYSSSKNKLSLKDNIYKYKTKLKLTRKLISKEIKRWIEENNYQKTSEENYFIRGEKRR